MDSSCVATKPSKEVHKVPSPDGPNMLSLMGERGPAPIHCNGGNNLPVVGRDFLTFWGESEQLGKLLIVVAGVDYYTKQPN